jgi:hypothetical protein
MKIVKLISIIIGCFCSMLLYSQEDISEYDNLEAAISQQFAKTISELRGSLKEKDPYGFILSVKISNQEAGETSYSLYENQDVFDDLHYQATVFNSQENFFKFNFDRDVKEFKKPGQYIYASGNLGKLVSDNTTEYLVHARKYTHKRNLNGKFTAYTIHTSAVALVEKPGGGTVVTDLYFYDEEGNEMLWDGSWGNKVPEVAYIRVGPGSKTSNTGKNPDIKGKPDHNGQLVVQGDYSPGYYQPVVEFRGCKQDFTSYDRFQDFSVILQLEETGINWNQFTQFADGTIIPASSLKTETMKAGDLKSNFSKGNSIQGKIYDSRTGDLLEKSIKVTIKPKFSPAKFETLSIQSNPDGSFEFTEIESGIYDIYPEENKDKAQRIEICNCPKKQESANHTYTTVLMYSETLYTITAEYKNKELFDAKVMWKNVTIGFPDDIHQEPTLIEQPASGQSVDMYDLKPPFTVILPPFGKFSFYSAIPEANEDCIVLSKKINNPVMKECIIDGGSFTIKKSKIESPHIFAFLNFDVELKNDEEGVFLLIPVAAGAISDKSPSTFDWKQLDYSIIERLKNGQSASKSLTNSQGASMEITFDPQN